MIRPPREMSSSNEQIAPFSDIIHSAKYDGSFGTANNEERVDPLSFYLPLADGTKEFRLLTLLAGQGNDGLVCLLRHADLGANPLPQYETISYCWADPKKRSTIIVNDLAVSVLLNAAAALRRMRRPHFARVVWLDAVCINQKDIAERSQQVTMMGDLYRNGIRNLIYLGEEDVEPAINSIAAILDEARGYPDSFTRLKNELGTWQYSSTRIAAEYDSEALLKFFRIPWFRRLWVVQEAALAQKNLCFCGSSEFNLLDVTRAAAWLIYHYYFVDSDLRLQCSYAADMNDLVDSTYGYHRLKGGRPAGALYLLDLSQQRLAAEAVDKVYAILALSVTPEGKSQFDIVPDYKKNPAEVFRDAARCLIQNGGDLQILDYVRHVSFEGEVRLDGFLSWVPKWHMSKDLEEHPNFMSLSFDACSGRKASLPCTPNFEGGGSDTLEVKGIEIDRVQSTTERMEASSSLQAELLDAWFDQVRRMVSEADSNNVTDRDTDLSLAITMVAGVDLHYKPVTPDIVKGYVGFRELLKQGFLPPWTSEIGGDHDHAAVLAGQYQEAFWNACKNRCFFVTASGYFGLGPHFMRRDDVVAILYGLQFPAIFRPIGDNYIFLGTAYLHGIMNGEIVRRHEAAGATDDTFRIR